ncbi:hypothetical protein FB451DRAFT_1548371 [Mycena latifolia]|nr:hypothetical protein FB451DRAFT_1548371 [Mycena latifolia]
MSNAKLRERASELILDISHKQLLLDDIQRQLDSIVYPVLTLPPEITSEIFVHCLPARRDFDVVNLDEAPLLLMHVCSAWRQIAISIAALWTTLHIDMQDIGPHFSEIVRIWLSRARQRPLSVKIVGLLSKIRDFDGFLETFCRHAGRMHSLELNIAPGDFNNMDKHRLAFSLLHSLTIRPDIECGQWLGDPNAIEIFHEVPMLNEVLMVDTPPSFIALPWKQLRKFTGEMFTVPNCMEALHLMPNLVEGRFAVRDMYINHVPSTVISHPKMESFTLFSVSTDKSGVANSTEILGYLSLPGLQTLQILSPDPGLFDDTVFDSFLWRSAPPLRKLVIRGDAEIQVQSLSAVPSLTDLEISYPRSEFVEDFFELFGHDTTFVPRLQRVSFLKCRQRESYADLYEIIDMAAAPMTDRMKNQDGFGRLQSFRLVSEDSRSYIPPPFAEELPFKKLKADGMDIYIGTRLKSVI